MSVSFETAQSFLNKEVFLQTTDTRKRWICSVAQVKAILGPCLFFVEKGSGRQWGIDIEEIASIDHSLVKEEK